jgi:hypothetical protein
LVEGTVFVPDNYECVFGSSVVAGTFINRTFISCPIPPAPDGQEELLEVDFSILRSGESYADTTSFFYYGIIKKIKSPQIKSTQFFFLSITTVCPLEVDTCGGCLEKPFCGWCLSTGSCLAEEECELGWNNALTGCPGKFLTNELFSFHLF